MGSIVAARVTVGVEMIRFFLAKSLKLSLPITVVNDVGLFVPLVDERSGLPVGPSEAEPVNMLPGTEVVQARGRTAFEVGRRTWDHTRLWGMQIH